MRKKHSTDDSPETLDNKSTPENKVNGHPPVLKFDSAAERYNGHNKLKLPEEDKHQYESNKGVFNIDFSNDPVMKSLLEAKQDQIALQLQRLYLSKS